ncbi:nuclear transport factor 2 family protein [Streptomyces sp. NPDC002643]
MTTTAATRRTLAATLMAAALTAAVAVPAAAAPSAATVRHTGHHATAGHGESARLAYQKSVAVGVLKGLFERGDTKIVDRYVLPNYIQHNPTLPDGTAAFKKLGTALHQQFPNTKINVTHVISEGDLVVIHSNVIAVPGTLGSAQFDIYRFQGGKIAEHWDSIQDVPATTANGHDMFSTLSQPTTHQLGPRSLTAYNKKLVTDFFDQLMVREDLSAIDKYDSPNYIQHNPITPDGPEGLKATLGPYFDAYPQSTAIPKRIIAQGDLVAVHSNFVTGPDDRGQSVIDLFRVQNGKIVEHWDVMQAVPATSANDNTMF